MVKDYDHIARSIGSASSGSIKKLQKIIRDKTLKLLSHKTYLSLILCVCVSRHLLTRQAQALRSAASKHLDQ